MSDKKFYPQQVTVVAALSENNVIGNGAEIPWKCPSDLQWFKASTLGQVLVMGRKTYESIGRPLPKRHTVIVTRNPDYQVPDAYRDNVSVCNSLDAAITFARAAFPEREIFVAGGGEIYKQALEISNDMILTKIHAEVEGDVFFPEFDKSEWHIASCSDLIQTANDQYPMTVSVWGKVTK